MAGKLTSQTVYWMSTLAVLIVFVASYAFMDLATKHSMYVKIEHKPNYKSESSLSNFRCASEQNETASGDIRDISPSNRLSDAEVDFELSSFTEDTMDGNFDEDERLIPTVANGAEENDNISVLDMKNGVDVSSEESDQNTTYYDPQVYIDHYKNVTINDGSMTITDSPQVIFIMAQWRFGSSVFGELFNQNSDLFYLFEPLWTTNLLRKMKGIRLFTPESQQMSRNILRKLAKCQFDADYVKVLDSWNGKIKNKAICRASPKCRVISPSWMSNLCRKYKGRVAAKLIRANLELLKPLVVDDNINLKIIHLVRDPRGSALSRINNRVQLSGGVKFEKRSQFPKLGRLKPLGLFSVTPETSETVRGMCQWIRENVIVSPDLLPAWLQGRYYLVRYEDFADTPLKVTKDLYSFVGIPFRKEVQDWVIRNTHVPVSDTDLYSTHKNSHVASTHWVKDLTPMEVGQIEEECMDVLKLMGYRPYNQLIHKEK